MTHWTDTISADRHRTRPWPGRIRGRLADYAGTLTTWRRRAAERRQLLALDARLLKDIGISRADAVNEAGKPFWRK
ncbi:MAG: DUF1127 domain-containing protein [Alphaproteobacteria bacterium]